MGFGRVARFALVAVCVAVGFMLTAGGVVFAAEHTVVVPAKVFGKLPARPAPIGDSLLVVDDCASSESNPGWAYICTFSKYQAWFKFDVSGLPAGATIQSLQLNAMMYGDDGSSERTLWYDTDDSWDGETSCPGEEPGSEQVGALVHDNIDPEWFLFDVDLSQHDWADDLADGAITLMVTGGLDRVHRDGHIALSDSGDGPSLIITYADGVPALGGWGMVGLSLALMGFALLALRRRKGATQQG